MRKYAQRKALIMGPAWPRREKGAKLSTKAHLISQDNEEPREWEKGEVNELCHLASVAAGTGPEPECLCVFVYMRKRDEVLVLCLHEVRRHVSPLSSCNTTRHCSR